MRTTIAAVAVVGVALLVGSVALVGVLGHTLTRGVRGAAQLRAHEVAVDLEAVGGPVNLDDGDTDEQLIQVLDGHGRVLASSPNMAGRPAVVGLAPGRSSEVDVPVSPDQFVVVAVAAKTSAGTVTVIVGRTLSDVRESTGVVTALLGIGLPLLLLVVAFTTWKVVGRALAPVERMRAEVDEISSAALHRRVPQPSGQDEIARLAATMNRMLGRLEASHVRERRFVSDASHELRSPVASIRQHAEVAIAHSDRTTVDELAETVLAEDLRLQHLVEDLLLLASADEGTLTPGGRTVDVDDLVFEEAKRVRDTSRLLVDATSVSGGRVRGDPAQLRRMIRNLVENASRHARSRITVSLTEHEDGYVVLRVDDDGTGIPAAERQRVFERFVRLDDARARDEGGAGLGLAIVAEVAAAHLGTATAAGAPGGGARLEVRLPMSSD